MNIQTRYWPLPIPVRDFDWMAYDADTHEGEGSIVGWGRTEQEAIDELMPPLLESQEAAWEDMSEAERDRRDYEHGSPLHLMRYAVDALRRAETELCELMYRRAKQFSDDSQGPNIGLELQEEEIAP